MRFRSIPSTEISVSTCGYPCTIGASSYPAPVGSYRKPLGSASTILCGTFHHWCTRTWKSWAHLNSPAFRRRYFSDRPQARWASTRCGVPFVRNLFACMPNTRADIARNKYRRGFIHLELNARRARSYRNRCREKRGILGRRGIFEASYTMSR